MKKLPEMQIKNIGGIYYPQFKKLLWRYFVTRKRTMADCWDEIVSFPTFQEAEDFLNEVSGRFQTRGAIDTVTIYNQQNNVGENRIDYAQLAKQMLAH